MTSKSADNADAIAIRPAPSSFAPGAATGWPMHRNGSRLGSMTFLSDLRPAAITAGITTFIWYACGALPLQIEINNQMGLSAAESSSWIFIIWFSGAVTSILLGLYYRLPLPVTWTVPGLIYLGTLGGTFSFAEVAAASFVAGFAILLLGALGVGKRLMAWLPLPIVMACSPAASSPT